MLSADELPALNGEIYRVDPDGRRIDLSNSPFADTQPFVSPDGTRVAFFSDRGGRQALYEVGVDGHGLTRMSGALSQLTVPEPIGWLPGTRRFLVVTAKGTLGVQLVAFGAGSAPRVLAHSGSLNGVESTTVSPDGRFIAYRGDGYLNVVRVGAANVGGIPGDRIRLARRSVRGGGSS